MEIFWLMNVNGGPGKRFRFMSAVGHKRTLASAALQNRQAFSALKAKRSRGRWSDECH
jgi:hypothetical protein